MGLLVYINDVYGLGLNTAQGMLLTEGFYLDMNDETRNWSKRFEEKTALVVLNFTTKEQRMEYDVEGLRLLVSSYGKATESVLQPLEGRVYIDY